MNPEQKTVPDPEMVTEPKICESCGEQFGCGASLETCWCFDVNLAADSPGELKSEYTDCLCPKCLEKIQKAQDSKPVKA